YARAEPLFQQALDIYKQALGEKHPNYAASLNNLAVLYRSMGDYARAEPLYRQALDINKQALGEKNADYAASLYNLALLYAFMNEPTRGQPHSQQAVQIIRALIDRTSAVQSERQQLAMTEKLRRFLNGYLAITSSAR